MNKRNEFLESINMKNDLKYRYYTLDRKIQNYIDEMLKRNNIEYKNNMPLRDKLLYMMYLYPKKRSILEKIMQMYYSDIILTENSLEMLENLYKELKGGDVNESHKC